MASEYLFLIFVACLQDFSGGLLWPTSRQNTVITQSCSNLHPNFRSRVAISRKCNDNGSWGPVDESNCTALENANPILIISFKVNVSRSDAEAIADNVSLNILVQMKGNKNLVIII